MSVVALLLQACGGNASPAASAPTAAPASQPTAAAAQGAATAASGTAATPAPAATTAPSGKAYTVTQWVYSQINLIKDTLEPAPATQKTGVIDFFAWNIDEFKKVAPQTTIKVELLPHDSSWFAKLDASLVAGTQPDIVQGPASEVGRYVPLGAVAPIDDYLTADDKKDISPGVLTESTFSGKNYLWPWRLSFGGGVWLNGTLWKEHGVGNLLPTGDTRDWLFDDFDKGLKATTVSSGGTTSLYGIVMAADVTIYSLNQFLLSQGAKLYNDDESKFILNSPEGVKALEWLAGLELTDKFAEPGTAARQSKDASSLFQSQKVAAQPAEGMGLVAPDLKDKFEWYWVRPPHLPNTKPSVETNIHGHYVMQQKDSGQTAAAQQYGHFLVRADALQVSLKIGLTPVRQSLWSQVTDPNEKVGLRFTEIMTSFGRRASATTINFTLIPRMYQAVFSKQKSPQQALDDLAKDANKALQDAIAEEAKKKSS
ncbi:MAG TPA: extracellular solute-binding protein [Chloroflexota bacterium]|nr:extracellular solute-binding protein [Chloroflexota bacterium]